MNRSFLSFVAVSGLLLGCAQASSSGDLGSSGSAGSTAQGGSAGAAGTGAAGTAGTGAAGTGGTTACTKPAGCGYGCAALCNGGDACQIGPDCKSGNCSGLVCSTCGDGVQNGSETGPDCGDTSATAGNCAKGCVGADCTLGTDCASGSCDALKCSLCDDAKQDNDETGIDCGGGCGKCTDEACSAPEECASGKCEGDKCAKRLCVEGWASATKTSTGSSNCLCADVQNPPQSGCSTQSDRVGCAAILDCFVAHASECTTFDACLSQNPGSNSKVCDSYFTNSPFREYAKYSWDAMCTP